jgi:hypothetical protein
MEKKLAIPVVHIDKLELSNTLEILIRPGTPQQTNAGEISINSDKLGRITVETLMSVTERNLEITLPTTSLELKHPRGRL